MSKTYKRASSTSKRTVAALATTLEKVAELENIHAKASITPTRVCLFPPPHLPLTSPSPPPHLPLTSPSPPPHLPSPLLSPPPLLHLPLTSPSPPLLSSASAPPPAPSSPPLPFSPASSSSPFRHPISPILSKNVRGTISERWTPTMR